MDRGYFEPNNVWNAKENLIRKFILENDLCTAVWCAWPIVKGMIDKVYCQLELDNESMWTEWSMSGLESVTSSKYVGEVVVYRSS